jgi:uncharacterized DUF497 family protein
MVDVVYRFRITQAATEKLGRRGISVAEAQQLIGNPKLLRPNFGRRRSSRELRRRLISGRTDGGRSLTLVIEQTYDSTTWLIVTGWESTKRERKMLRR